MAARRGAPRPGPPRGEPCGAGARVRARAGFRPRAGGPCARLSARRAARHGHASRCGACSRPMPHHHRAWLAYGDALFDLQQYDDARIAFERARLTDPERVRVEQATAALVADDRRKAEELFRAILQADPSHVAALRRPRGALADRRQALGCRTPAAPCAEASRARTARVARTRAGADRARARAGGRGGGASTAADRAGESAVLGHGGRGGHAPAAAGAGARGLSSRRRRSSRTRNSSGSRSGTRRRHSAGAATARPRTRPRWRSIRPWARPTGVLRT